MPTKIEKDAISGQMTTGHEWDGLKELDTPMPRWWLWTFYATVVFALAWVVIYPAIPVSGLTGLSGWTARGALPAEIAAERARIEPMLARLREATPGEIAADPEMRAFALAGGRGAFNNTCAGCHGAGGQGALGFPSLADDDWLFGGKLDEIQHTIRHGVRAGESDDQRGIAMPAFLSTGMLNAAQVNDTAEYVLSLTGRATNAEAAGRGEALFSENCASCHGERGEGNRDMGAPRLNDRIWLFGGDKAAIMRTIAYSRAGVMPSWQGRLDPAVVNMLTLYVHSLGGGE
ncbi:cytochrome-c oxidase, cbb3-type subunit III [Sabulicella rubraurantiaca]|uniref:cytochrome-c oxidase, cbb3-type subunit III n=1 Tax=Sabulicella rubraurantiaca TaxID=2811429 RepID=UPI001A956879|nr:cytochrome-c oxidase, cbb3-type subunit III [Sabulicella rubraurantiaca]